MIAGAAYNLAKKLTDIREVTVSEEVNVGEPVFEDPKNIIYVIGDGMGFNSLKLGEELYESGSMEKNWETKSGYHRAKHKRELGGMKWQLNRTPT